MFCIQVVPSPAFVWHVEHVCNIFNMSGWGCPWGGLRYAIQPVKSGHILSTLKTPKISYWWACLKSRHVLFFKINVTCICYSFNRLWWELEQILTDDFNRHWRLQSNAIKVVKIIPGEKTVFETNYLSFTAPAVLKRRNHIIWSSLFLCSVWAEKQWKYIYFHHLPNPFLITTVGAFQTDNKCKPISNLSQHNNF